MAGTIPLSMTQQMDEFGAPLAGGLLYFIQAGTTSTPQNAYQDSGLTLPLANPVTLDAAGRVPQLFLADATEAPMTGLIKIRLTDSVGVTQLVADNVMVIGPSGGGGGGGGVVDPTTIYQTGDLKPRYGTGAHTGWVRANALTIGSATSGATERANADTQALFEYLWQVDSTLAVSGGRGGSAAADWAANKMIATPDGRGRVMAALSDMGNTDSGRLTASYFGTSATVLGAAGGGESLALSIAQLPSHDHTALTGAMNSNQTHSHTTVASVQSGVGGSGVAIFGALNSTITSSSVNLDHSHAIPAQGAGSPHRTVQPTMLVTIYLKL